MSQTHDSVLSIIFVLGLLVLIALATLLYGGNAEQKAKVNNNPLLHKSVLVFNFSLGLLENITDIGLNEKKYSVSKNLSPDLDTRQVAGLDVPKNSQKGIFSKILNNINQAWLESDQNLESTKSKSFLDSKNIDNFLESKTSPSKDFSNEGEGNNISNFIKWHSLNDGAELIFRSENGREYKMFLPFRFLSERKNN